MHELHEAKQYPVDELDFFVECAVEIARCRQVLRWSYVVKYWMEGDKDLANEVALFLH